MVDDKEMKMTKVTKTSVTLGVMAANGDKPMAVVVPMILEAQHAAGFTDVTLKICEGAYRWAVRKSVAPGAVPAKAKKDKLVAAVKREGREYKKIKTKKEAVARVAAPTKTPEEIERIRAANLARLKEVAGRVKQTVRKPEAEAELELGGDRDPFAAPAFLTKDEVIALV